MMLSKAKVVVAARLRYLAQKMDPQPTMTRAQPGGGWLIEMQGVPLAEITSGQIRTERHIWGAGD